MNDLEDDISSKVLGSADMNISEQCGIAASKGNQILGLIRRTIIILYPCTKQ